MGLERTTSGGAGMLWVLLRFRVGSGVCGCPATIRGEVVSQEMLTRIGGSAQVTMSAMGTDLSVACEGGVVSVRLLVEALDVRPCM